MLREAPSPAKEDPVLAASGETPRHSLADHSHLDLSRCTATSSASASEVFMVTSPHPEAI